MNVGANGYPNANTDPRLPLIYDPNPMGRYVAYDVSKSSTEISDLATDSVKVYQSLGIKSANYYCVIDSQAVQGWATYQGNEHLTFSWINAAEVSLSKAECYLNGYGVAANATKAKECFVQGVAQSFEYYKNLKTKSTLYKAVDATHFNDSYGGKRITKLPTEAQAMASQRLLSPPMHRQAAIQRLHIVCLIPAMNSPTTPKMFKLSLQRSIKSLRVITQNSSGQIRKTTIIWLHLTNI